MLEAVGKKGTRYDRDNLDKWRKIGKKLSRTVKKQTG